MSGIERLAMVARVSAKMALLGGAIISGGRADLSNEQQLWLAVFTICLTGFFLVAKGWPR